MKGMCTALFLGGLALALYMVVEQSTRHNHVSPAQEQSRRSIATLPGEAAPAR